MTHPMQSAIDAILLDLDSNINIVPAIQAELADARAQNADYVETINKLRSQLSSCYARLNEKDELIRELRSRLPREVTIIYRHAPDENGLTHTLVLPDGTQKAISEGRAGVLLGKGKAELVQDEPPPVPP